MLDAARAFLLCLLLVLASVSLGRAQVTTGGDSGGTLTLGGGGWPTGGTLTTGTIGLSGGVLTISGSNDVYINVNLLSRPAFFNGEVTLDVVRSVRYLAFPNGSPFGYYNVFTDPHYIYHYDMGYEYVFDAQDSGNGVYLYDFKSGTFFYTSPVFSFPYLYDFSLNAVLYYYPDPDNADRYNTNGVRWFYNFSNGQVISK